MAIKKFSMGGAKTTSKTSSEELYTAIQKRAYELFEKRGYTNGNDLNDWLRAEEQIKKSLGLMKR